MLYLPNNLPAAKTLREENFEIAEGCAPKESAALRVLLLNIMPQKAVTELDIARMMAQSGHTVELTLLKLDGATFKTTPMAHMEAFYRNVSEVVNDGTTYDGLIITGAPVEHLPFEEVRYWESLCWLMGWADVHVRSTLYICWGAQAGLYHHYGVPKYGLEAKMFGIFAQKVLISSHQLMNGLLPEFFMPNSRHTEVRAVDISRHSELLILASSEESGVGVVAEENGRRVFIVGHLEYEPHTLENEYRRDLAKGLPIAVPQHYYKNDDPQRADILFQWRDAATTFYCNWLDILRSGRE